MPPLEWRRMTTDDSAVPASSPAADPPRFRPEPDVLSGENADVYFERAARILAAEGIDPVVSMEIFCRAESAVLCGAAETLAYLRAALGPLQPHEPHPSTQRPVPVPCNGGSAIRSTRAGMPTTTAPAGTS